MVLGGCDGRLSIGAVPCAPKTLRSDATGCQELSRARVLSEVILL